MAAAAEPLPQAPARAAGDNTMCTLAALPVFKMAPNAVIPCPAPNQDGGSVWHFGILPALKMAPPSRLPSPTESRRAPALCPAPHLACSQSASRGAPGRQPSEAGGPRPCYQDDISDSQWGVGAGEAGRAAPPFCESITRSGWVRSCYSGASTPFPTGLLRVQWTGESPPARASARAAPCRGPGSSVAGPFPGCGGGGEGGRGWGPAPGAGALPEGGAPRVRPGRPAGARRERVGVGGGGRRCGRGDVLRGPPSRSPSPRGECVCVGGALLRGRRPGRGASWGPCPAGGSRSVPGVPPGGGRRDWAKGGGGGGGGRRVGVRPGGVGGPYLVCGGGAGDGGRGRAPIVWRGGVVVWGGWGVFLLDSLLWAVFSARTSPVAAGGARRLPRRRYLRRRGAGAEPFSAPNPSEAELPPCLTPPVFPGRSSLYLGRHWFLFNHRLAPWLASEVFALKVMLYHGSSVRSEVSVFLLSRTAYFFFFLVIWFLCLLERGS